MDDRYEELRRRIDVHREILALLFEHVEKRGLADRSDFIETLDLVAAFGRKQNEPSEVIEEFRLMADALRP